MHSRLRLLCIALLWLASLSSLALAGTTGKIAGRITATDTREPLIGVSVRVEGTSLGASTDVDGNYTIIGIPPGTYAVTATGVGLQKKQVQNVKIAVDFTTRLDIDLSTDVIALDAVIVQAEAPMLRKDLTSSQTVVDAAVIKALPVENVTQLLALQAGITQGSGGELHIRGGRSTEISYEINGVSIINPFDNSRAVQIATNAIQELSVVSGTFNAEYGNALSGIVNTVTKEGSSVYRGSISAYTGDFVSTRTDVFPYVDRVKPLNHYVTEATLSGPIPGASDFLNFFVSGRYDRDRGWLFGQREHLPTDSVVTDVFDPNKMVVTSSGDNALVAMNPSMEFSTTGKLTFTPISAVKVKYDFIYSKSDYKSYSHDLKYNPDAAYNNNEWGMFHSAEIRHAVDDKTYYTIKGSYNLNDYQQYLYPLIDKRTGAVANFHAGMTLDTAIYAADPRYQPDYKSIRPLIYSFLTGGTSNGQYYQRSNTLGAKFDLTSQIGAHHEVKLGAEYRAHRLDYESFTVLRDTVRYWNPTIPGVNTPERDSFTRRPKEFSAYAQDKLEFDNLVMNVGLRYDYLKPGALYSTNVTYPSPNDPRLPPQIDPSTILKRASSKHQLSPRFGLSFPITDRGIIHFSYGHFFQIPPFRYLYANPGFKYNYASGQQVFGNANLNPEKTITYEIGLQQQLFDNLAFTVTGYYKDVRDLLALQQIRVSGEATYLMYVNKDYANIRGVTVSLTKRRIAGDMLGVTVDYTLQVAEGNDTDADAFFLDLASGRQTEKVPVYLAWDQTHTLNTTVSLGTPGEWNVALIGRLGTGLPYTPQLLEKTVFLRSNSSRKPSQATVDLMADYTFRFFGADITAFAKVFNLFDTLNESYVYDDTGRATYSLLQQRPDALSTDAMAAHTPGLHSAQEYFSRPEYYRPPREIRVGVSVELSSEAGL